jgi:hypothetical protein
MATPETNETQNAAANTVSEVLILRKAEVVYLTDIVGEKCEDLEQAGAECKATEETPMDKEIKMTCDILSRLTCEQNDDWAEMPLDMLQSLHGRIASEIAKRAK